MIKSISAAVLALFGFVEAGSTAEHVVRQGDTLTAIARKTGFTPAQLAQMNEISLDGAIIVGQKLKYFTDAEIIAAKLWCLQRMTELPASDQNYAFFKYTVTDLEKRYFRFSIYEPSGLHVSNIFVFAEAWRRYHST